MLHDRCANFSASASTLRPHVQQPPPAALPRCACLAGSLHTQACRLRCAKAARFGQHAPHCHALGRYHSHPNFAPQPSDKDNDNQRNYQAQFHDEACRQEPFVGAIVGPYDPALPTLVRNTGRGEL